MSDFLMIVLLLTVFVALLPLWRWSIERQVKKHHHVREERKRISQQTLLVVTHPHTPAGGLPATR